MAVASLPRVGEMPVLSDSETAKIVFVDTRNGTLARRAAERGIESTLVESDVLETAIALALEQLRELQTLRATFARLRLVERAKGILMERHQIPERGAHEMLHRQARNSNLRLSEVAEAVIETHLLLPDPPANPQPA
jgi:response regulator NasT